MGLLDRFRATSVSDGKSSASVAKKRLQILVAHDRAERDQPSYLSKMQTEILDVVRRYVTVEQDAIQVTYEKDDQREILELNIILPERARGG